MTTVVIVGEQDKRVLLDAALLQRVEHLPDAAVHGLHHGHVVFPRRLVHVPPTVPLGFRQVRPLVGGQRGVVREIEEERVLGVRVDEPHGLPGEEVREVAGFVYRHRSSIQARLAGGGVPEGKERTWQDYAWVSDRIPITRRHVISFGHHTLIARFSEHADIQDEWLRCWVLNG